MITEDYVSLETAKLLKEKGFDLPVNYVYHYWTNAPFFHRKMKNFNGEEYRHLKNEWYSAPTQFLVMKWLREVHNITIIPNVRVSDPITGIIDCYCVGIYHIPKNNGNTLCFTSPTPYEGYSSYEEACEAGIKYCLKNLI